MVPDIVIGRLPIYLRALMLLESEGALITSSQELGKRLGISSAQIRKDLSHFGEFGKQGTGYNVSYLMSQLKEILNLNRPWPVALIGFGDLGHALVHYAGFVTKGFYIQAVFDNAPHKVGQVVNNLTIYDSSKIEEVVKEKQLKIAILAVPL
ncbi:MAG: redox-sensing transcriptional repressor Rex [Anaerolineae bacterium]